MKIVEARYDSFDDYISEVEQIGIINPQERNYQYFIADFLKEILVHTDIQVIDVSTNRNTKIHNRDHYTGAGGTPDILLARGYQYKNKSDDELNVDYIAALEIKAPLEELNEKKNIEQHRTQIKSHLSKNEKVILTDCITWYFFKKDNLNQEAKLAPIKSFKLRTDFYINDKKEEGKANHFAKELLKGEFKELQSYIRGFIV
ncbi:hypothetical protein [Gracilibacillus thailandensis]|uniref:Uncharacterized protein n=1 Tax=Gracilibacillus thailandensis TaxID=563735 RepID=A0A6N7R234_9BACI|nr:hypothetical protein [Gracilibacillus thailandensis]MRI64776.1 hypothetical protein [Gracilibacillus thailandensis]